MSIFGKSPVVVDEKISALKASTKGKATSENLRINKTHDGLIRFVGAPSENSFLVKRTVGQTPEAKANDFLREMRNAFIQPSELVAFEVNRIKNGMGRDYIKFRQIYSGLPVFGGEINVQVSRTGGVECALSTLMTNSLPLDSGKVSVKPSITKEQSKKIAIKLMGEENPDIALSTSEPELVIYDPSILGISGPVQLVWLMVVSDDSSIDVSEQILVNAQDGMVALRYTLIKTAKNRQIYDSNNTTADPGTLMRSEGQAASGNADVDNAYTYFGDTYDFYYTNHGRDSIDNAGYTLSATVRFCRSGYTCPYQNAYWNGSRMYFGQGFTAADDVVGHELTHGVTQYESNLIYAYEPGAINESFSDMWGEWIDQSNTGGTDTEAVKWLIGEDVPVYGAARDMADPPAFGDPDRMRSANYYVGAADNGGVHYNSGVGNKLCYLLTDGDTFNGHTVSGMGIAATADLFYECQTNLLTTASDYRDLYSVLTQAAVNLDLSQTDRDNIEEACQAVEINQVIYTTHFTGGLPSGWTIVDGGSDGKTWNSTNPGGWGVTKWPTAWVNAYVAVPSGKFMIVDSDYAGSINMDEQLITHSIDCRGFENIIVEFRHWFFRYSTEICDVDIRVNAGAWQNIARYQNASAYGLMRLNVNAIANGQSNVQVRWHYYNANYEWFWGIDDVVLRGDPITYTLTYTAGANGLITGTTPQTVNYGGSGTQVTAVPDTGYHFVQWSDDVMTASRTDTNVTANITVTATFAINESLGITVTPNNWALGPVILSSVAESGSFSLQNSGNVAENFQINGADGTGGWILSNTIGQDAFKLDVDQDDNGSYDIVLTKINQLLFSNISIGGTKAIGLKYSAPSSDTKGQGVAQDFLITITASRYVP